MGRYLALLLSGCATSGNEAPDASAPGEDAAADAPGDLDATARPPCVEGDARATDPVSGHCCMLFNQARGWDAGVLACEAVGDGVHLATVSGDSENAVLDNLAGQEAWIGGNDIDVEMTFAWITGEPFAYTNFRSGEPGGGGGENCLMFQGQLGGEWDDRGCNTNRPILCERD